MDTNAKAYESTQEKLKALHAQQAKLKELQAELDVMERKLKKDEKLSKEDLKFAAELGWLSAAAVTISTIANSI